MHTVKCYGGPLHGQTMAVERDRFLAHTQSRSRRATWDPDPGFRYSPPNLSATTVTYMVEIFHERRGTAYRRTWVAVVEGLKNLLQHEEWEIERDMQYLPWTPIEKPSILREFDSWFNWCAYRHTHDSKYLHPEFQKYRME